MEERLRIRPIKSTFKGTVRRTDRGDPGSATPATAKNKKKPRSTSKVSGWDFSNEKF